MTDISVSSSNRAPTPGSPTPGNPNPGTGPPVIDDDGFRKLAPIVLGVAFGVAVSVATGSFAVVAFVMAIIAMVMIHEAGHFVTAKLCGMKVTEFFFGFGPRLWSMRKGETSYGVKALPLGGYVKIVGMSNLERDIDPADEARTYRQQSYPKRVLVAVAGIVTHFVVSFLLLLLLWTVLGVPRYDRPSLEVGSLSRLESGASPAIDAGLAVGDRIVSVDGRRLGGWGELQTYIRENPGRPVPLVVERMGRELTLTATPAEVGEGAERRGFIGVGAKPSVETVGPVAGVGRAAGDLWDLTTASVTGLGSFFTPGSLGDFAGQITGGTETTAEGTGGDNRFLSVVGVVRIAGQAAESGVFNVIYLLVLLNIFVGIFNLVPLLPLDGGHIAIATYERLRSRRGQRYHADVAKMMPVAAAVVTVLVVIGIASLYLDIVKPISNPIQ